MTRAGSGLAVVSHVTRWLRRLGGVTWRLITQTVGTCLRYRVTGLAAEGAFFAILSLPPLIFGLAGSIGYAADRFFEPQTIEEIRSELIILAERALTAESVQSVIVPTLDSVLVQGGRPDVISIGFLIALWSGSRALNVFVDTITIMYGMGGKRGIVRTRALSFSLYCIALVIGVIVLPLVLAGPAAVDSLLPERVDFLNQLYWPVVIVLSVGFLNSLYHLSVPVRTPWTSDLPGAAVALSLWILGSFILRWTLQTTVGGTSIYGPLAAPIAVLLWLYLTAIAVLIGAALNAVVDRMWPHRPGAGSPTDKPTATVAAEPDEPALTPVEPAAGAGGPAVAPPEKTPEPEPAKTPEPKPAKVPEPKPAKVPEPKPAKPKESPPARVPTEPATARTPAPRNGKPGAQPTSGNVA